ncbi:protein-tyrosine phosphatase-like protein [Mycena maculata]|uniref:protein-tyrosine-phosphatase n=1 Tax=Mycena maculata TaxID=230809 RepID=A0AAD7K6G5_9AGAR|nr:protein-tyrosine phosphatase-like protein [Mycena maculata]
MTAQLRVSSSVNCSPDREDITEILPNLFLGSQAGALNLDLLRRNGITHILSVMVLDPTQTAQQKGNSFQRMNIPVQDWPDEELVTHFKSANSFIDDARTTSGEGVLVHCYQGVSRSATVVAAYLMASHPPTPDYISAVKFLQSLRPIVQPNSGFLDQLALYGRCGCNMDDNFSAVEAWRAVRHRRWEGYVDKARRERAERAGRQSGWSTTLRRVSRWAVCVFG